MTYRKISRCDEVAISSMILIMGTTGSGKSFFINRLKKNAVKEEHGINAGKALRRTYEDVANRQDAGTTDCQLVTVKVNREMAIALIDTPGFDDPTRSDAEIFETIAEYLTVQYKLGIRLRGVIYLHRITDIRMPGSAIKYFNMFRELVGDRAMANVVLATTMWSKLADEAEGLAREQMLREQYWSLMEKKGSHIATYDGSSEMAEELIIQLASLDHDIVLKLQEEICIQNKRLDQTAAGSILVPEMDQALQEHDKELQSLDASLQAALRRGDAEAQRALELQKLDVQAQRKRKARWRDALRRKMARDAEEEINKKWNLGMKDALSILMTIIGITVNVIVAVV